MKILETEMDKSESNPSAVKEGEEVNDESKLGEAQAPDRTVAGCGDLQPLDVNLWCLIREQQE